MQLSNHSAAACRQHFLKRSEERPALAIQSPLPSNLRADVAHVGVVEVVRELADGFIVLYIRLANRRTKLVNVLLFQDPKRPSCQVLLQDSMSPLEDRETNVAQPRPRVDVPMFGDGVGVDLEHLVPDRL